MSLTLLLGVLCYAFYDCNVRDNTDEFVLSNELLTMREIKNKEDITMEMLSIPSDELLELKEEEKEEKEVDTISLEEVNNFEYEEEISYNEVLANEVVNYALMFVGNPYVYGGNSLTNGTDCSGFTMLVYQNFGISLPRSAPEQAYAGNSVSLDEIKPGDIVVSGYDGVVCHASLYIGDGQLVHALNSNVGIVVTSLYIMPIIDVRRVI